MDQPGGNDDSASRNSPSPTPSLRPSLGQPLPSYPALPDTSSSNQRFSIHGIVQGLANAVGKVRDREKDKNQVADEKELALKVAEALEPITDENGNVAKVGRIGVCALDIKARSKPCRFILNKLIEKGEFEIVIFGDKVILDEDIENWPTCDFLISFYSTGFPLRKAIAYAKLRKPFCVNDLLMQKVLWDRRLILRLLDMVKVPTAKRLEISRDGGPDLPEDVRELVERKLQYKIPPKDAPEWKAPAHVELSEDGNTLYVDGQSLRKPFVEKPVNGEDHNIHIYFKNGGGRRLFRKVGNKSSEYDAEMNMPRINGPGSYVYEQFLDVDNFEDVKAYTVGPDFCHAETRKSPVVDGLVRRNPQGKEVRFVTKLSKEEMEMASRICTVFGQRVCGFDLLRAHGHSYVIDVNGWSFVKDNNDYYDKCASIMRQMFIQAMADRAMKASLKEQQQAVLQNGSVKTVPSAIDFPEKSRKRTSFQSLLPGRSLGSHDDRSGILESNRSSGVGGAVFSSSPGSIASSISTHQEGSLKEGTVKEEPEPPKAPHHSWKLKGMVAILRHADRTPKQKFKLTFHSKPFIDLLNGHEEEVILVEDGLKNVVKAVELAIDEGVEDMDKLRLLQNALERKAGFPGTKVQVKPFYIEPEEPGSPRPQTAIKVEAPVLPKPEVKTIPSLMEAARIAAMSPETPRPSRPGTPKPVLASAELPTGIKTPPRRVLEKLQLIIKWGGEPTHSARYQAQDLGENMRKDLLLMNREALEDIEIYSSSERRVRASAQIWAGSFLGKDEIPDDFIQIRKDLLDDSNAAKRQMDAVKKEFKGLLREGLKAPPTFNWPKDMPDPCEVMKQVVELMKFLRKVMTYNFQKYSQSSPSPSSSMSSLASTVGSGKGTPLTLETIQTRWCCGENADLFRERWEKLFVEFCDWEKVDPSKVSELYDTMKYDALHNRQFLETIFTPPSHMLDEEAVSESQETLDSGSSTKEFEKSPGLREKLSHRRRSILHHSPRVSTEEEASRNYITNSSKSRKADYRLVKLRELYRLAKVLFDCVSPQEYGITNSEKLEIGLLTCLPLLKQIVKNLETVQASATAKSFFYFTKESHVYTLLNCIIQGGIPTKLISSNPDLPHIDIPELDYLTQICFELYESESKSKPGKTEADPYTPEYSIRISLSVGCHTESPLDVDLDSKHCIGCKPRRSMTQHDEWKSVLERLKEKFDTVKLPKRFLPIMLTKDDCDRAV
ncbi:hypothetical protein BJ508DRAFT_411174 [Ascobolus immersus RN42]|uniref:Inositol hexakisphosphate and diphosphoinositol-pentakisphosphate kinase n=1 Tax=Ascobolus immersus RN42 TaxID=1160509 RepID=A0A3N4ILD2_ASCIM|nr:hypothetical protein BJ508DRAFT_411174 [Ascobolus immersus RN42]